ncbi:MAG: Crotonyl-CoA reductase [Acidimicrobiales bacterium]|nr:MAG: crotonyl-CoA carboxylase/reductase [Actinomycetota bacterium]MBV6507335.1 Crotonyl-CoA reductase [Acidimicrobiales bacterium]RIK04466.1 MAG: crotonyl-CoA carboxylase/reductase [Acidobacteriota bacterium]
MRELGDAIKAGISADELARLPLPDTYRGAGIYRDDVGIFEGLDSAEKDPRKSIRLGEMTVPEMAPDEVAVAVMASSINFNTVWSSVFEPLPTFIFLERLGRESAWGARHDQDFHVLGSDASGVVLRVGSAVREWKPGDHVVVHPNYVDDQDPFGHDDAMMAANQRAWGFETNFGGLADMTVVKANQLMPKPAHLTWEEASVNALTASTSYRMLVGRNGARMKLGDVVLIWGASGGIGIYAAQMALRTGAIPVGVVSSPEKVELMHRMGVEHVIDRKAEGYEFWDGDVQNEKEWRRFGKKIRELVGEDPDIVFEHPGRSTMGASVYVAKRGGTIITCAATSGYTIEYDNRHLWMKLKTIKASHFANYRECWETNRLIDKGLIQPCISDVYRLEDAGEAAHQVHSNLHEGKLAILCLADEEGLGVTDREKRERIGEHNINAFRRHSRDVHSQPA